MNTKSTFFIVEVNARLSLKDLEKIEAVINAKVKEVSPFVSAVISNGEYKKSQYFEK